LVWWAWSAFVWAANAEEEQSRSLRVILLAAMMLAFLVGLAVPHAFAGQAMLFALAYAGVRFLHLGMYAVAARRGHARWSAISGFAVTVTIGMALLIAGALLSEGWQIGLWTAALLIDYAGPAWLTRERLRGLQQVAVAHFAERYGLFVIICLGESIVEIGASANTQALDSSVVTAVTFGLVSTIALWWLYFDRFAAFAESRLRTHDDVVLAAADAYSYLHLAIVAGIIVFAAGMKVAIDHVGHSLSDAARLAFCGGLVLYLLGNLAFRLRMGGAASSASLIGAAGLIAVYLFGSTLSALWITALTALVLVITCALDTFRAPGSV
jgi:low temperature requirement protein LtrA